MGDMIDRDAALAAIADLAKVFREYGAINGAGAFDAMHDILAALPAVTQPAPDAALIREALHPDAMLPEAIRLIRQEATRDHSQDVVSVLKQVALLLEQLTEKPHDRA